MNRLAIILFLLLLVPVSAAGETALIEAVRDATLIEHPEGALSNGAGLALFVGRTAQSRNAVRRGLLYFDVAAALPENATIESASLVLFVTSGNSATRELRLHRVLSDWGEGNSFSSGGSGAPSTPGDATWQHAFYDDDSWPMSGGHFVRQASAHAEVGGAGFYTWQDAGLARDVRFWNAAPHRNFGWILLGAESVVQSVKKFASREEPDPSLRPMLEVTYQLKDD